MTARILDITPEQYHRDPCSRPSLSCSIAKILVTKSPLHAWTAHPQFGNVREEATQPQDDGSIIHKLLLGKGVDVEVITGFANFKKKAAQELRDAATEAGKIPMLEQKYAAIQAAAEVLRANLAEQGVELNGASEVAIEWEAAGNDGPVLCRSMLDHVFIDAGRIIDLKKITSADSFTCENHGYRYGYDMQCHAYPLALAALRPGLVGRVEFSFAFMEIEPPYAVRVVPPNGEMRALGEMRWGRAVALWERCAARNRWPGYNETIAPLGVPGWAIRQEEALGASW